MNKIEINKNLTVYKKFTKKYFFKDRNKTFYENQEIFHRYVLSLIEDGINIKELSSLLEIDLEEAEKYINNYMNGTFGRFLLSWDMSTHTVKNIPIKRIYINVLSTKYKYIEPVVAVLALREVGIKTTPRSIEKNKNSSFLIPEDFNKFSHIIPIYQKYLLKLEKSMEIKIF